MEKAVQFKVEATYAFRFTYFCLTGWMKARQQLVIATAGCQSQGERVKWLIATPVRHDCSLKELLDAMPTLHRSVLDVSA